MNSVAKTYQLFINAKWVKPASRKWNSIKSPADGRTLARVAVGNEKDAQKAIGVARKAFDSGVWSGKTPGERSTVLLRLADLLEKNTPRLAKLESLNQGKTIKQSLESDFPFSVDNIRFFAGMSRNLEGKAAAEYAGFGTSYLRREPIGVVACIVPWNYPLFIAVWQGIPALAMGNTVVVKPASHTPITLLEFADLTAQAGIPPGVFNVITGPGEVIGTELASNPNVDMVAVTGDIETGKKVMAKAAGTLKKVHLELGGKAPFIVLDDADLDAASEGAVVGGFINGGQDCTAAARLYVHERVHKKFVQLLVQKARRMRVGHSLNKGTDLGPLVSETHLERVQSFIETGKREGAKLALGGMRSTDKLLAKGNYLMPTILMNVKQHSTVCQKEIFGPVLAVLKFKSDEEVVRMANDVKYGLAGSIWGKDITRITRMANRLRFGEVWINDHGILASEMPHGGYKMSGSGRDLSAYALEEFTQLKHVYVDLTGKKRKPWYYTVYGKK